MYYSPSASGTILPPDNVCTQSTNYFYRFDVIHNIESGFGHIHFVSHDNNDSFIDMTRRNGLWYFHNHQLAIVQDPTKSPTANVLTQKFLNLNYGIIASAILANVAYNKQQNVLMDFLQGLNIIHFVPAKCAWMLSHINIPSLKTQMMKIFSQVSAST